MSKDNDNHSLPTPEELRAERERRARERVKNLEDEIYSNEFDLNEQINSLKEKHNQIEDNLSDESETSNTDSTNDDKEQSRTNDNSFNSNHVIKKDFAEESSSNNSKKNETKTSTINKLLYYFDISYQVVGRILFYIVLIAMFAGMLIAGTGVGYFIHLVRQTEPPTVEDMEKAINHYDQQSTLYYGDGSQIATVRSDIVRTVTSLEDVSDYIVDGFIATEDSYFYEHPGVVPKAIIRATLESILFSGGTGGSTITQQLVKQQMLSNDVTFFRKANEILLAMRVDHYFSKDDILTAYLNVSPFGRNNKGENIAGIYQAAQGLFGKTPAEVNLPQAAFIVGLPQDPYSYTPYTQNGTFRENIEPGIERMKEVLFRMYREQKISKDEYEKALSYDITSDFIPGEQRTPVYQSYLYNSVMDAATEKLMLLMIAEDNLTWRQVWEDDEWYNEYYFKALDALTTGGYHVYSTIDQQIYDQLQVSAKENEEYTGIVYDGIYIDPQTGEEFYYVEKVQTGTVVIDNPTGKVLGFIAGTDFENNQIDHAFKMRRSPGSTIKPLAVYAPAVEHNIITPATRIPDTYFSQVFEDGSTWEPTNYGMTMSNTFLTARTALLRSDNLPAVRIYKTLLDQGIPVIDYLEKMGFNTIDSYTLEDTQNLAFSLGGVTSGPTVFEETRAFTTFANNGMYNNSYLIERIEDSYGNIIFEHDPTPIRVFSEDTNYIMVDMLRDTMTSGTGRTARERLDVPGDWIAKTGISENSKDIWVLASTPKITIGQWIGYDSRFEDYTIDVNDGFGLESVRSQIYWAAIVNDLYNIRPEIFGTDLVFSQPESVIQQQVLQQTGTLPGTLQHQGRVVNLVQPLVTELFKVSHPAPPLTIDILIGANENELSRFWTEILSTIPDPRKEESSEEDESNEDDENESEGESSAEEISSDQSSSE